MNRLHWLERLLASGATMTALTNRLKAATLGFGVTVAPLAVVVAAQLIFMPQIVAAMAGIDRNDRALAVSSLRTEWVTMHSIVAAAFALYWLLTALIGKGQLLKIRVANIILGFCIFCYLSITLIYVFVDLPEGLKVVCPLFGISDTDAPRFACDPQSSCDAAVYPVHLLIALAPLGLIVPLTISLIVRIVSSRRAASANG